MTTLGTDDRGKCQYLKAPSFGQKFECPERTQPLIKSGLYCGHIDNCGRCKIWKDEQEITAQKPIFYPVPPEQPPLGSKFDAGKPQWSLLPWRALRDDEQEITAQKPIFYPVPPEQPPLGSKFDAGKPQWSLLPWRALRDVVRVLTMGAKKYSRDNWKHVDNARERYSDATMRHFVAWATGERVDSESGITHLAHAVCCLLFLMWFDDETAHGVGDDQ